MRLTVDGVCLQYHENDLSRQSWLPLKRNGSKMDIKRSGSQPSTKGSAEYFTGNVRIDPLFEPPEPEHRLGVLLHLNQALEPYGIHILLDRVW